MRQDASRFVAGTEFRLYQRMRSYFDRSFRVLHMASCARSGETLMLRLLAAHSQVLVAFDLSRKNSPQERAMREFFKHYEGFEVRESQLPEGVQVPAETKVIIVKQGIWEHRYRFDGFVLVRNPASVAASLLEYDQRSLRRAPPDVRPFWRDEAKLDEHDIDFTARHWERLVRWQDDIDAELTPHLKHLDYLSAICAFYNRRMLPLADAGMPVVHYERLVTRPEVTLRKLFTYLGLEFDGTVIESDHQYTGEAIGHGKNELKRPIDTESIYRYQRVINFQEFSRIAALTLPTWKAFRYTMSYDRICVATPYDDLMIAPSSGQTLG